MAKLVARPTLFGVSVCMGRNIPKVADDCYGLGSNEVQLPVGRCLRSPWLLTIDKIPSAPLSRPNRRDSKLGLVTSETGTISTVTVQALAVSSVRRRSNARYAKYICTATPTASLSSSYRAWNTASVREIATTTSRRLCINQSHISPMLVRSWLIQSIAASHTTESKSYISYR